MMSLPHLPHHYTRKDMYEAAIVRRRNQDNDYNHHWSDVSKYFQKQNVNCMKDKVWTSNQTFQDSMEAFSKQHEKEVKELNLKRRRSELSAMLSDESDRYQAELGGLSKDNISRLQEMKGRSEELKSAREEKRKLIAADLLYERWKKNDPKLRRLEEEQHKHYVIGKWDDQKTERNEALESARQEEKKFANEYEQERVNAIERMKEKQREKLEEEKKLKAVLKEQIEELRRQETEAAVLRLEQDELMKEKWQLEKIAEKRKMEEQQRKTKDLGRTLLRQHAASLKRKSRLIQDELERDRKLLEELATKEVDDRRQLTTRREKAKADAQWMKQVIEEQLKVERTREAELDMLYADEAAREWEKREAQWAREQVARERLMQEVMDGRQDQIRHRMSAIREEQEDSLKRREDLLREIEMANQLTKRDQDQADQAKTHRREELEAQMTSREEKRRVDEDLLKLELNEELKAEEDYEELLRVETERMKIQGFQPKIHSRRGPPKSAWM